MEKPHKPFDEIGDELDKLGLFWVDAETTAEINEFEAQRLQIDTKIDEYAAKLYRSHAKNLEQLTEAEFAAIISQMIKSGDFMRNVQGDKSSLNYLPFRERENLEARIRELERALNQIYHYTDCTAYQIEIINEVCPQTVG